MAYLTKLHIPKMDCSAEASLVEMRLKEVVGIGRLDFDLPNRSLSVHHAGPVQEVIAAVDTLGFGARLISSDPTAEALTAEDTGLNAKVLWIVLAINFGFFGIELSAGILARSMGLLADSLDMLADALVYGLSLYAVGHAVSRKKKVAALAAYLQFFLAAMGLIEVLRRFLSPGESPAFLFMVGVSLCALAANAYTLWLLNKAKTGEAHIQASVICTSNDVIANAGVIVAGILVLATKSTIPDLLIGLIVFVLVGRGASSMLALSK
jgi:Co/Zn/Cd efflux system component